MLPEINIVINVSALICFFLLVVNVYNLNRMQSFHITLPRNVISTSNNNHGNNTMAAYKTTLPFLINLTGE